jgi:hypothetical protein
VHVAVTDQPRLLMAISIAAADEGGQVSLRRGSGG